MHEQAERDELPGEQENAISDTAIEIRPGDITEATMSDLSMDSSSFWWILCHSLDDWWLLELERLVQPAMNDW